MGYNASVLSIGTASYPVLGGALAMFGWYYPFLLPLLAIPIALIVIFKLNNPEPKNTQNLGKYLITAAKYINNRKVYALFTAATVTFIILYGAYITYFPFIIASFGGSAFYYRDGYVFHVNYYRFNLFPIRQLNQAFLRSQIT